MRAKLLACVGALCNTGRVSSPMHTIHQKRRGQLERRCLRNRSNSPYCQFPQARTQKKAPTHLTRTAHRGKGCEYHDHCSSLIGLIRLSTPDITRSGSTRDVPFYDKTMTTCIPIRITRFCKPTSTLSRVEHESSVFCSVPKSTFLSFKNKVPPSLTFLLIA